jgi:hypothetical protein
MRKFHGLALARLVSTRRRSVADRNATRIRTVTTDRAIQPLQLALNGGPDVLDQMESISDLSCLRCALAGSVGIKPVAIAGDRLDTWMIGKPQSDRCPSRLQPQRRQPRQAKPARRARRRDRRPSRPQPQRQQPRQAKPPHRPRRQDRWLLRPLGDG